MLKKILFFIIVIITACNTSDNKKLNTDLINNPNSADAIIDTTKLPIIVFDTLAHDFGDIKEGEKVDFDFNFINNGKGSLLLTDVHASCGCTTPFYPKNIIKPGEKEKIKVQYNSEGRPGKFTKGITVTANTFPNVTKLRISGNVIPKK
jgi:hypothetical protein